MLTSLAIWYLRRRKRSVLIGFEADGGQVKSQSNRTFVYDSTFRNVIFKEADGEVLILPKGKFSIRRRTNDAEG
ncbi:hypothetical protein NQS36_04030 [Bacillus sp. C1(2022)]|jgi:hypothetical protein|uniref:hypothetical protein n=1 Tax=Bacillus TaxID=1386 RepID=UPI00055809EE|nr:MULTISPECIES: hypothetical protein [Bacillus]MDQ9095526.1 hypothetical protein [Bacillus licheniformis]MEC0476899.1 hypothetical protein [Bacillus licheniformis]MEC0491135.1 hypothetical protein [Bacillus licheniformis]MED1659531.1 hypothetical protein [Bacillus licheniformis]PAV33873.1 hypothetical protein CJD29_20440 [Bacillus licheniformis]